MSRAARTVFWGIYLFGFALYLASLALPGMTTDGIFHSETFPGFWCALFAIPYWPVQMLVFGTPVACLAANSYRNPERKWMTLFFLPAFLLSGLAACGLMLSDEYWRGMQVGYKLWCLSLFVMASAFVVMLVAPEQPEEVRGGAKRYRHKVVAS